MVPFPVDLPEFDGATGTNTGGGLGVKIAALGIHELATADARTPVGASALTVPLPENEHATFT